LWLHTKLRVTNIDTDNTNKLINQEKTFKISSELRENDFGGRSFKSI